MRRMRVVIGGTFPMLTAMSLTVQWDLSPASQCHAVRLGGIAGTSAGTTGTIATTRSFSGRLRRIRGIAAWCRIARRCHGTSLTLKFVGWCPRGDSKSRHAV